MNKGKFIVFEGCEGVGKSTQISLLKEYFKNTEQKAIFTREPGGTPLAEEIRNLIKSDNSITAIEEAYLFAGARAHHVSNVIIPALNQGISVVCDRFILSSLAYQGKARGLGYSVINEINHHAMQGIKPDVTIFFDLSPRQSFRKAQGKVIENDRIENESDAFHALVFDGFKELIKKDNSIISISPTGNKDNTFNLVLDTLKRGGYVK